MNKHEWPIINTQEQTNSAETIDKRPETVRPEIDKDGEYQERNSRRTEIFNKILGQKLSFEGFKGIISNIISKRKERQETYLREVHQKSDEELEEEYEKRYKKIEDLDFEQTEAKQKLARRLASESAYYELNPDGDWRESEAEEAERRFIRGAMVKEYLNSLGLSEYELASEKSNLDVSKGELVAEYNDTPENAEEFTKENAKTIISNMFKINGNTEKTAELLEKMKAHLGINELTTIVEDIFDSHEGYSDNFNDNIFHDDWETPEGLPEDFRSKVEDIITEKEAVFERNQTWKEYYLVNNGLGTDNISKKDLAMDWDNVGVTNNLMCALIQDYGNLRLNAFENGSNEEVLEALDDAVIEEFTKKGDKEAGETVVKLAVLRFFTEKYQDMDDNDEKKDRVKEALIKAIQ